MDTVINAFNILYIFVHYVYSARLRAFESPINVRTPCTKTCLVDKKYFPASYQHTKRRYMDPS